MIRVDIPMPGNCEDCPFSYIIRTGELEGRMMCNAMEARAIALSLREPETVVYNPFLPEDCLVDGFRTNRPDSCPIVEEE